MESNPVTELCMKRLRLFSCPLLGKLKRKIGARAGEAVRFSPRAEGTEGGEAGAAGWSALTCYWGVRQRCVS